MAIYDYTLLNPIHPLTAASTRDLEAAVARCLSRVKKACKGVVAHTLESQVARIQLARKKTELALAIAEQEPCGLFGWLAKRRKIAAIKKVLDNLRNKLLTWVYSVYSYFIA